MSAQTVSVGHCYSIVEATMIRSLLGARGIEAIIPGLGSGSFTLAYTSAFTSQVLVSREHAEEASALILQLREGQSEDELQVDAREEALEAAQQAAAAEEPPAEALAAPQEDTAEEREAQDEVALAAMGARRRQIAVTLVAATLVPFGLGHAVNRAFGRALMLAGLQVLGLWYVMAGHRVGLVLSFLALLADLFGGAMLARGHGAPLAAGAARPPQSLPVAKAVSAKAPPLERR